MKTHFRLAAWGIALGIGFLSMSEEILWIRVISFVKNGVPQAFAFVLAFFLVGVASGAMAGRYFCSSDSKRTFAHGVWLILLASLTTLGLPMFIVWSRSMESFADILLAMAILISAALKSTLFPIAHHLGSEISSQHAGHTISRVYFLNIAGSTLGPLLTGFVLLDYFSTQAMFQFLGISGLLLAVVLAINNMVARVLVAIVVILTGVRLVDPAAHEMIIALAETGDAGEIAKVVENRHGILHTVDDSSADDVVYGGNVYDGRTNIDLRINSNRIDRVYLLAALHPAPKRVLVIGLSTGAWTRVLATFPTVEQIDIVEINPGYLRLIQHYDHLSPILTDSRVRVHIDDGRRWLRHHSREKFDLIVMNVTLHWRAYSTHLLSDEFMHIAYAHLSTGGILAFNATGSPDALFTAANVFSHAYRWGSFVYAAEHDFRNQLHVYPSTDERVYSLRWLQQPVLERSKATDRAAVDLMLNQPFIPLAKVSEEMERPLEIITDENMITEYKYGRGF